MTPEEAQLKFQRWLNDTVKAGSQELHLPPERVLWCLLWVAQQQALMLSEHIKR